MLSNSLMGLTMKQRWICAFSVYPFWSLSNTTQRKRKENYKHKDLMYTNLRHIQWHTIQAALSWAIYSGIPFAAVLPLCGLYWYYRNCLYIFICTVGKPQPKSIEDFAGLCAEVDSSINWKLFGQRRDLVRRVQEGYETYDPAKLRDKEFLRLSMHAVWISLSSWEPKI